MTSTVEWHRYGDTQPEDGTECRVRLHGRSEFAQYDYRLNGKGAPYWAGDFDGYDVHPGDLWCYLPVPPNVGEE